VRDTTPQTTPLVVPAQSHGKTTLTVPPSDDQDMHMAQDPNEDSTFANVDNFINKYGLDDELFASLGEYPLQMVPR
jgi:hypothetical protein